MVPRFGTTERYRCRGDIENVEECIDEDYTIDGIAKVPGEGEGADDGSYSQPRKHGGAALDDGQGKQLLMGVGHGVIRYIDGRNMRIFKVRTTDDLT